MATVYDWMGNPYPDEASMLACIASSKSEEALAACSDAAWGGAEPEPKPVPGSEFRSLSVIVR